MDEIDRYDRKTDEYHTSNFFTLVRDGITSKQKWKLFSSAMFQCDLTRIYALASINQ